MIDIRLVSPPMLQAPGGIKFKTEFHTRQTAGLYGDFEGRKMQKEIIERITCFLGLLGGLPCEANIDVVVILGNAELLGYIELYNALKEHAALEIIGEVECAMIPFTGDFDQSIIRVIYKQTISFVGVAAVPATQTITFASIPTASAN